MNYSYKCECGSKIDRDFPMGKAKKSVKCYKCGEKAYRNYSFATLIPDAISDARIGRGKGD